MTATDSTSSELLARIQSRDHEAFQLLVLWASPLVARWLEPMRLSAADFDDVFQETFLSVYLNIDSYRRTLGGTFRGWLRTIAQRKAIDLKRKLQPQLTDEQCAELATPATDEDSSSLSDESDVRRSIWIACRATETQFSPGVWQAFWQTTVLSRSTAEVAEALGLSQVAVRKYKSRVLAALRAELAFWS